MLSAKKSEKGKEKREKTGEEEEDITELEIYQFK